LAAAKRWVPVSEDALGLDPRILSVCLGTTRSPYRGGRETVWLHHPAIPLEETMSAVSTPAQADGRERDGRTEPNRLRRLSTETKASFKTTEFFAFLVVLAGILISAGVVDEANNGGFGARQAWLYATILTVGYMVSRGLAKSGTQQPYDEDRS
jgi:hypothetical protein